MEACAASGYIAAQAMAEQLSFAAWCLKLPRESNLRILRASLSKIDGAHGVFKTENAIAMCDLLIKQCQL